MKNYIDSYTTYLNIIYERVDRCSFEFNAKR